MAVVARLPPRIMIMIHSCSIVSDSHHQSTLDAVNVHVVPWSEFPIVPSYPHYPQSFIALNISPKSFLGYICPGFGVC